MTLGFVANRHLLLTVAFPGEQPQLISWHNNQYKMSQSLLEFPHFTDMQVKMADQRQSILAGGEEYGLDSLSLHGGVGTISPPDVLARVVAIARDPNSFVGFYNFEGFFSPFFAKLFELLEQDVTPLRLWAVCDIAWLYKAFLAGIPVERLQSQEMIPEVLAMKTKGGLNITALAHALGLDVPKGVNYAASDLAKVQAVYNLVFAKT